jgi:2-deoxy-D-gluconate 3-dehydrogenase
MQPSVSGLTSDLKERVVVVTGGSRGIGLEIARLLLAQGARVTICARKTEGLTAAAAELGGGDALLALQAHVGREEEVEGLFEQTVAHFGAVDGLVNNVGMNLITGAADADPGAWRKVIDSNLNATFLCCRAASRRMRERRRGKIVSITSLAARRARPALGVYGVAKAGIEMLTRVLAQELGPFNIQVNAVAPGLVRTAFSQPFWSNAEILAHVVREIPQGRIAEPLDVARPVVFLLSSGSDFITGQTLAVDGGASAV